MRRAIVLSVIALCVLLVGCTRREPRIEGDASQKLIEAMKAQSAAAPAPAAAASTAAQQPPAEKPSGELAEGYVRVPDLKVAVQTDGQWKNEFLPGAGGLAWPRRNERGIVAGSIHFLVMPKFFPTVQEEAEAGRAAMKKSQLFVKEGSHFQSLTVDGRRAHVTSYHGKVGEKNLYTLQVTMEYDDKHRLLLSCAYEKGLTDDISEEMLKKVQSLKFVSE